MAKPDPAAELRGTATYIRTVADQAAYDTDDNVLCCWDFERIAGHERVIAVRRGPDGDDQDIVAIPTAPGIAEHIAVWEPPVAHQAADLLDKLAVYADVTDVHVTMAVASARMLAKLIGNDRPHDPQPVPAV
jgi:hypothetical protein